MHLTFYLFELVAGALLLMWSADRFIDSSVALAKYFKLPPLVIGVVLVGFGTSFPEFVVAIFSSARGSAEIAVGNVVGSNTANIGLVLALAAIVTPIAAHSRLIRRELPFLIVVSLLLGGIFYNSYLSRFEGVILLVVFLVYLYFMLGKKSTNNDPLLSQDKPTLPKAKAVRWWLFGLAILLGSSELFIRGAVGIARWFDVSELLIGLTIVTLGTSLPELAATLISALKKQYDIAIGHIIGSNIFNSLMVLAMPALIHPGRLPNSVIRRDYPVMLGFTLVMWGVLFFSRKKQVGRLLGLLFLFGYTLYLASLILL